jgi:hypothetical protein
MGWTTNQERLKEELEKLERKAKKEQAWLDNM